MTLILPNGQLAETSDSQSYPPVFNTAFRPFFWLGALFSVFSILFWSFSFAGLIEFQPNGGSYLWHIHEMLFGYFPAIMSGFLLTAVQTWTKQPCINGWPLAGLTFLWLAGRITAFFPPDIEFNLFALLDSLFLPVAAAFLAKPIISARMWRNLFFVPVMLTMGLLNLMFHLSVAGVVDVSATDITHTMVLLIALVMCIMGGRVFPMFTANGTRTPRVNALPWLEKLAISTVVLSVIVSVVGSLISIQVVAAVYILAGISNLLRGLRWRIWVTFRVPLVWSLHISYLAVGTGFILLGLTSLGILENASIAYHTFTVGGIGIMTLSMISRVSLGHTGRFIESNIPVTLSLLFMVAAFIVRTLGPFADFEYSSVIYGAAVLWALAFSIFVVVYAPILFKSRPDGVAG